LPQYEDWHPKYNCLAADAVLGVVISGSELSLINYAAAKNDLPSPKVLKVDLILVVFVCMQKRD
jgi:hypothetical protein